MGCYHGLAARRLLPISLQVLTLCLHGENGVLGEVA